MIESSGTFNISVTNGMCDSMIITDAKTVFSHISDEMENREEAIPNEKVEEVKKLKGLKKAKSVLPLSNIEQNLTIKSKYLIKGAGLVSNYRNWSGGDTAKIRAMISFGTGSSVFFCAAVGGTVGWYFGNLAGAFIGGTSGALVGYFSGKKVMDICAVYKISKSEDYKKFIVGRGKDFIANYKILQEKYGNIFKKFICPLSGKFIIHPVRHQNKGKIVFEKESLKQYLNEPNREAYIECKSVNNKWKIDEFVFDFDYLPKLSTAIAKFSKDKFAKNMTTFLSYNCKVINEYKVSALNGLISTLADQRKNLDLSIKEYTQISKFLNNELERSEELYLRNKYLNDKLASGANGKDEVKK